MALQIDGIPSGRQVPEVLVVFDPSRADQVAAELPYRVLLIGQKTVEGTGDAEISYRVRNLGEVINYAGRRSVLRHMAESFFRVNTSTEVWIGVLDDPGAGTAATGNITVTGTAAKAGTFHLYAGGETTPGRHFEIAIDEGDTQNEIATKIADAVTADLDASVTAVVDGGIPNKVNFTYIHKGSIGNHFVLEANVRDGEAFPEGVAASIFGLTGGAGNPLLAPMFFWIPNQWFNLMVHPYYDSGPLAELDDELTDRNGPTRSMDGIAIGAHGARSYGSMIALVDALNSEFICIPACSWYRTNAYQVSAQLAGVVAIEAQKDPARPFNTLALRDVIPPNPPEQFTTQERNGLLVSGASTLKVTRSGEAQIERLVTTYKRDAADQPSTAYKSVETVLTLMYLRYELRRRLAAKYSRSKVAADGTPIQPGQKVATPSILRSEAVGWFRDMQAKGLVQNVDAFKAGLVVEIDGTNPGIINMLTPPDLIRQLLAIHGAIQFG